MSSRTPSYRRHKPSGQAVVTLNGHDVYLGKHGTPESRGEYDRLLAEWLSNGRQLPASTPDRTIVELMLPYIRHADSYYTKDGRPTSHLLIVKLALKVVKELYGHTPARDFGPLALKTVRAQFVKQGLCRNEVNSRTANVVRFFRWLVENEMVPASVHHGLKSVPGLRKGRTVAPDHAPVRPVPEAHIDAVLPLVSRHFRAMIELQRLTGMRPGEVTIMRTADLDMSGPVWVYVPERHKTEHHDRKRIIYLGPRAQDILRPWLRADRDAYLFQPAEAVAERKAELRRNRKTPVQPSQRDRSNPDSPRIFGDHYKVGTYRYAIQRACDKAGVMVWHPHQLRHNAATALRREFGIDTARVILGHTTPIVTEIYAEPDREKAILAMVRIG